MCWVEQWIARNGGRFWYKIGENEVWVTSRFICVFHLIVGMRLMLPMRHQDEKITRALIVSILDDQEKVY